MDFFFLGAFLGALGFFVFLLPFFLMGLRLLGALFLPVFLGAMAKWKLLWIDLLEFYYHGAHMQHDKKIIIKILESHKRLSIN